MQSPISCLTSDRTGQPPQNITLRHTYARTLKPDPHGIITRTYVCTYAPGKGLRGEEGSNQLCVREGTNGSSARKLGEMRALLEAGRSSPGQATAAGSLIVMRGNRTGHARLPLPQIARIV